MNLIKTEAIFVELSNPDNHTLRLPTKSFKTIFPFFPDFILISHFLKYYAEKFPHFSMSTKQC